MGVAFIVGQKARHVAAYLMTHPLPCPVLVNDDRGVIKAYDVHHRIGLTAWNIARPATVLLDREGAVRYTYVGRDQTDRPSLDAILAQARALSTHGVEDHPSGGPA